MFNNREMSELLLENTEAVKVIFMKTQVTLNVKKKYTKVSITVISG